MAKNYYYSYEEFRKDTQELVNMSRAYKPDALLGVARGGLTLAHLMSQAFDLNKIYTINSVHYDGELKLDTHKIFNIPDLSNSKKILIVDDIIDSGETMYDILKILKEKFPKSEFRVATLFYKKDALIQADYSIKVADRWIDFFWGVDVV